jgi:ferrochelatase
MADILTGALRELPDARRGDAHILFTAHSIPLAMARHSRYEAQLAESARLVATAAGAARHEVAYQSRSGSPSVPWLEPDVCDRLRELAAAGVTDVVVVPLGFVSDHVEVLYDLDDEARAVADELGLTMVRAATVGTHPRFVAGLRELIAERLDPAADRPALGRDGPSHDVCPVGCCLPGSGRPSPWDVAAPTA